MEDWQGCLSPSCQTALRHARQSVEARGGNAVTVEDFLLALLDSEPALIAFLTRQGVDQDELVRTIQCEQPVVTTVSGEDILSSQLQYLFAMAREQHSGPWLHWPALLRALTQATERLQGKAYVAVLEQVPHWPDEGASDVAIPDRPGDAKPPVVVTDSNWLTFAEDIAVALAADPRALVWVSGPEGAGKSCWLDSLIPLLSQGVVQLDLRSEREVMSLTGTELPVGGRASSACPVLVLDQVAPADLVELLAQREHVGNFVLPGYQGPVLLLGVPGADDLWAAPRLQRLLGRGLSQHTFPPASGSQLLAVLTVHQPRIEKRWGVELDLEALSRVANTLSGSAATPGQALNWLERAAARVSLRAEQGPWEARRLAAEADTLRRQQLVALARHLPISELDDALQRLSVDRAACEVGWQERQAAGELRRVTVADVLAERERLVAGDGTMERRHSPGRRMADRARIHAVT
ncbi:MAG: hypothetical protein R3175_16745 [Marinobacter sp.]|uniref:hypothetical protein n=1 Tax=Marinobacter sp. TaxID=50741 RepID=UPI00299E45C2|nr:hypothetical protein [Marinobacter sp.]MDX1757707.1 hypothetical protein [Marinobacter sp.]